MSFKNTSMTMDEKICANLKKKQQKKQKKQQQQQKQNKKGQRRTRDTEQVSIFEEQIFKLIRKKITALETSTLKLNSAKNFYNPSFSKVSEIQ